MSRSSNKAARIIRERKAANGLGNRRSTLNNAVAAATGDRSVRKAVAAALRKTAKPMRESGDLGAVKSKRCNVADGVRGVKHVYTRQQVRKVAAAYNPRKAEYKAVRAALLAA